MKPESMKGHCTFPLHDKSYLKQLGGIREKEQPQDTLLTNI